MFAAWAAVTALAAPPSDEALERRLAAAFAAAPRLAGLTVSVVDRVAVVGGPVPDAAAKRQAETLLRTVDGLEAVRLTCWVPMAADPFVERVKGKLAPPKPVPPPPKPQSLGELPLALPLPAANLVTAERQTVEHRGWLGSPVVGGGHIPPAGVPAVPPARFARLTSSDPRFRRLTVDVSPAGVATIAGVGDPAAGWELAAVLRHQPGVTRVVVGDIRER